MIRIMQTIISIEPDGLDLSDLTVQAAFLGLLADRIRDKGYEVPKELLDTLKRSERELAYRMRDDKERRLQLLRARREGLRTLDEKRAAMDTEIQALESSLTQNP